METEIKVAIESMMESYGAMSPKERAREMAEALKFCLRHKLVSGDEEKQMQADRGYQAKLAQKCLLRRLLYLRAHPEATEEMLQGKVIWRRPKN